MSSPPRARRSLFERLTPRFALGLCSAGCAHDGGKREQPGLDRLGAACAPISPGPLQHAEHPLGHLRFRFAIGRLDLPGRAGEADATANSTRERAGCLAPSNEDLHDS